MADFIVAIAEAEVSGVPMDAHVLLFILFWLGVDANSIEIIPSFTCLQLEGLILGLVFNDAISCTISLPLFLSDSLA